MNKLKPLLKQYSMQIAVVVSTVFALVMNFLAITLPLNGRSTQAISDSFKVFFVPAGYVFSIWGIIYMGLIAFAIYQFSPWGMKDERLKKLRLPVILSSVFNGIWIVWWHFGLLELATITMLLLLGTLIYIYGQIPYWNERMGRVFRFTTALPFSIYIGWISVATIANITVQLYSLGWSGLGLGGEYWAGLLCLVAADLAINIMWIRRDYVYAAVIVWSVIGIYVKFANTPALAITAIIAVGLIGLTALYFLYRQLIAWLKRNNKVEVKDSEETSIQTKSDSENTISTTTPADLVIATEPTGTVVVEETKQAEVKFEEVKVESTDAETPKLEA